MTPEQREELKKAALAADQNGQHMYTHPRDSNNWRRNDRFNAMASPAVVLSLIAQVEALIVPQVDAAIQAAPETWPELTQQIRTMRAIFHVNMLRAYPGKSHAEITAEIDRALDPEQPRGGPFTYTVDGEVMSPLEYINYLHDQIGADKRKETELRRVNEERGLQISRLEVALSRSSPISQQEPTEWRYRPRKYRGIWSTTSSALMIDRLKQHDEEFWEIDALFAAPTIPAIPGTKEGA